MRKRLPISVTETLRTLNNCLGYVNRHIDGDFKDFFDPNELEYWVRILELFAGNSCKDANYFQVTILNNPKEVSAFILTARDYFLQNALKGATLN